jgi:RNA polymerase sigma factor (sigma-70 family)
LRPCGFRPRLVRRFAALVNSATREAQIATAQRRPRTPRAVRAEALAAQIYAAHRVRLLALARRNCACSEDAEEALHDAFALFIDHFDPDSETPPLAWLTLTLKRACWARSERERRARREGHPFGRTVSFADRAELIAADQSLTEELAGELGEARERLARLRPAERTALGLFAVGYSYREICALTGWTYTRVNRCIAEGRARLREPR